MQPQQFYTTDEYAQLYRYADARPVLRLIKRGVIRAIKRHDGRYLIPARYIKGVIDEKQTAVTAQ